MGLIWNGKSSHDDGTHPMGLFTIPFKDHVGITRPGYDIHSSPWFFDGSLAH
jgi:hypothetical protein